MENASNAGGRRRGTTKHSAEDQALDQIAKERTPVAMIAGQVHAGTAEAMDAPRSEGAGDAAPSKDIVCGAESRTASRSEEDRLESPDVSLDFESGGSDFGDAVARAPERVPSAHDCEDEDEDFHDADDTTGSGGGGHWLVEEDDEGLIVDFLDKNTDQAEARLAARRQARAEAREIRMRELERQQREADENADRLYDMHPEGVLRTPPSRPAGQPRTPVVNNGSGQGSGGPGSQGSAGSGGPGGGQVVANHQWSRRSSEDSLEGDRSARDVRHELKEVDDKFRKAMIQNAQLDNEKASYTYQVELLKDRLEDLEVAHAQLQRENREKCREADQLKRLSQRLKEDLEICRAALEERDRLIEEQGLVIVGDEGDLDGCEEGPEGQTGERRTPRKALVSIESADMLQRAGEGSLDVRLRKLAEERNELLDQIRRLKLELEEERSRHRNGPRTLNGPDADMEDLQREAQKLLGDYKFKLQKAEQDVSTLQANVARLESQVIRYKSAAETAEKVEDELKVEKRKLQRELRESLAHAEELETANSHLQRRLDKLKNAKSALLKDL